MARHFLGARTQSRSMDDNKLAYHNAKGLRALVREDSWLGTIKNAFTPAPVLRGNMCPCRIQGAPELL